MFDSITCLRSAPGATSAVFRGEHFEGDAHVLFGEAAFVVTQGYVTEVTALGGKVYDFKSGATSGYHMIKNLED